MRKRLFASLLVSLLLAALLCTGCAGAEPPVEAAPLPEPSEPPATPTPAALPTPCVHRWEDGVCALCGQICEHDAGFDEGVCLRCGWVCPHEEHDDKAVCLLCGEQRWHSYEHGLCVGCGREPLLYDDMLPEKYLKPAEHRGACLSDVLVWPNGREYPLSVYLPYDYDENSRYNLVIVLLGDNNHAADCTDTVHTLHHTDFRMANIYDHLIEDHLCAPFILVGVEHMRSMYDSKFFEDVLRSSLLPYLAETYATWIEDGDYTAAREHIALCGASRGAIYTLQGGIRYCSDLVANFCCMSIGYVMHSALNDANSALVQRYEIRRFVGVWGWSDSYAWNGDHHSLENIVEEFDCLQEGDNALLLGVHDGHNWITWGAGLFAALQYMF